MTASFKQQLEAFRNSGEVKRCHVLRCIGEYTVATHAWNVAILVNLVTEWRPTLQMVQWALIHDSPEVETGDVPAPIKWDYPEVESRLRGIEETWFRDMQVPQHIHQSNHYYAIPRMIVKFCDCIELGFWVRDQMRLGNSTLYEMLGRIELGMYKRLTSFKDVLGNTEVQAILWEDGPSVRTIYANLNALLCILTEDE